MNEPLKSVSPDDLVGAVCIEGKWRFFLGTVAEWIMDYQSYDPYFEPTQSDVIFRGNMLSIDDLNKHQFGDVMSPYELTPEDLRALIRAHQPHAVPLMFVMDFDRHLFVSRFEDIPVHKYVPEGWQGYEDDPIKYVPENVRRYWS